MLILYKNCVIYENLDYHTSHEIDDASSKCALWAFKQECACFPKTFTFFTFFTWTYTNLEFRCHRKWSLGATESEVLIGNLNVKARKTTTHKLHKIWRSLKFCKISGKQAHPRKQELALKYEYAVRDGSRIPRRTGRRPSGGGANIWFCLIFQKKNCMTLRKFWSVGGSLGSATGCGISIVLL